MFGTDLQSAYAPFSTNDTSNYADVFSTQEPSSMEVSHKSTPLSQIQHNATPQSTMLLPASKQQNQLAVTQPSMIQSPYSNEQQDPRIAVLINELKKQQKIVANIENQNGYFDKMAAKKKDVMRIFQLSLVIVLALSIHFIIDYYLKNYIKNNDLSFERELVLRLLYPIAILFVIWNMKAFLK
jgi:hypothetical protein